MCECEPRMYLLSHPSQPFGLGAADTKLQRASIMFTNECKKAGISTLE